MSINAAYIICSAMVGSPTFLVSLNMYILKVD